MKDAKLSFYEVDDYIEYLSKFDSHVMHTKIESRKFKRKYIWILFKINEKLYIAPLSSYKEKHNRIKENIDFIKIGNKSVINLNNMFPVQKENIAIVNIEKEEDINYKQLLRNEYALCIPKFKKIIKNAKNLYKQVTIYNMPIKNRCCNFKLLEEKCLEFNLKNNHQK